jgi:hypothetical protein
MTALNFVRVHTSYRGRVTKTHFLVSTISTTDLIEATDRLVL